MSDDYDTTTKEDQELIESHIFDDDVNQELEVLKLMGIARPNKRLVALKLQAQQNELLFAELTSEGSLVLLGTQPEPNTRAISELLHFALAHPLIASIIYDFLEDPETNFDATLRELKRFGIIKSITRAYRTKSSGGSVAQLIIRLLTNSGPQSRDQIIEAVTPSHISKRPAAAIRTTLRRLIASQVIQQIGEDTYGLKKKR